MTEPFYLSSNAILYCEINIFLSILKCILIELQFKLRSEKIYRSSVVQVKEYKKRVLCAQT